MATPTVQGIVLLAHGSRDERWRLPIEAVAARVRALSPAALVRCAYLELAEPDLRTAAAALAGEGATAIRVVPMFLGMGKHAREDIPRQFDALRAEWPALAFTLGPTVGESPQVIDLLARIAAEI
ncbi:sirohydrochlorin chelatase [Variovorax sp. UC122_21]|uniref:sirohydrochlorin chelatase n=1 Tax=Variovorax TaxID=34072 RepID=UPI0019332D57|nr:CbiX/SirB N-terminal domain-containing protein [Variovorax paradoxus]